MRHPDRCGKGQPQPRFPDLLAEAVEDRIRVFRLSDGAHEIGYAFSEVVDFASIDNDVIHAEIPGEINGVTLINGEPAELVDAHWLFSHHLGPAARSQPRYSATL